MKKTVTVNLDAENVLTFDPSTPRELGQGDFVEWDFSNTPSGSLPIIEFDTALGPFQCLQFLPNAVVRGKGNVGAQEDQDYHYRAMLLDASGVLARSGDLQGVVRNLQQPANTSPVYVIQV
ncbi:MAG TPA: hypothetical protein VFC23_02960, partial [Thermoanaerobaculia bacterium]|nr:hypothetical protein [Thermoanaerobaculia bacterium]